MEETVPTVATSTSRVLHVRNLPTEVLEKEIWMLASPFGMVNIIILSYD